MRTLSSRGAATALFQAVVKVSAQTVKCGSRARYQSRNNAKQDCESQRLNIEMHVERNRAAAIRRQQVADRAAHPCGQGGAGQSTAGGHQKALPEDLPDQTHAPRAQSNPPPELPAAPHD